MNIKFIILFFLLAFIQDTIPKKANKIIIHTQSNPEENFISFGKFLIENGFIFENKDKDFLTLKTEPKGVKSGGGLADYKLLISFVKSDINIKIKMGVHSILVDFSWFDWDYRSNPGTYNNAIFKDIDSCLRRYSAEIEYIRE